MIQTTIEVKNNEGLHARPASEFSKASMKYKSDIKVYKNGQEKAYNPKSILSIMSMGAVKGDVLRIEASGEDEAAAIEDLKTILESFDK
ncbi:MAG: Phosphotransferase system, phosphocarrier protein HPr [Clostridia bacterium]|jgi:phosphotransferase system HPr (HPr) family protein|nr:Phosphotransferase system, phosphocarrier protein HPr [Clostridia bacterium]